MNFLFNKNPEKKTLKKFQPLVEAINNLEPKIQGFSDDKIIRRIQNFREKLTAEKHKNYKNSQKELDLITIEVFALVREASKRVLGMRHFDVQLMGGVCLHQGNVAEMRTGEGKTLVATLPAILNALTGRGVHVVTVNDYLASRDSEWMGKLYKFLGFSVGLINQHKNTSSLAKRKAYNSDITYVTNNELGFDYLRDNMASSLEEQVLRDFNFCIIDEVDSVLIDEARTPLIISGRPETSKKEVYLLADQFIKILKEAKDKEDETGDYYLEEKQKNAVLTDLGVKKAENFFKVKDLWSTENELAHHIIQALKAREFFKRDTDYIVQLNKETHKKEIVIVDEFTGRLMPGRRWSDGLHQAIESKEKIEIQEESITMASITFQNFFKLYPKISGMTGTAATEEEEFRNIYNLGVHILPTNKVNQRTDQDDQVYKNQKQKFYAVVQEIISEHKKNRPVLVGTTSIQKSERLATMLKKPQELVELLSFQSERLIKNLEEFTKKSNSKESTEKIKELIKEIKKSVDRPFNIKLSSLKETFETFERTKQPSVLEDSISQALESFFKTKENNLKQKKEKKNFFSKLHTVFESQNQSKRSDFDLTSAFISFLKSAECVEYIKKGLKINVLNAKEHQREADIIAQAGTPGAITISTNMAGRGTDILLGGNAEFLAKETVDKLNLSPGSLEYEATLIENLRKLQPKILENRKKVIEAGGLHVIGTERHESRRIDNQLRGRTGRQGDSGTTRFYLALDDDLMRIFGGQRIANLMNSWNTEEDIALELPIISRGVEEAQKKVESHNSMIRKNLFEIDGVQDIQRKVFFKERQKILEGQDLEESFQKMLQEKIDGIIYNHLDPEKPPVYWLEKIDPRDWGEKDQEILKNQDSDNLPTRLELLIGNLFSEIPVLEKQNLKIEDLEEVSFSELQSKLQEAGKASLQQKQEELGQEVSKEAKKVILLTCLDNYWVEHLSKLENIKENIHFRGYGQKQPLIEYKIEALALFDKLIVSIRERAINWLFHAEAIKKEKKDLLV